MKSSLRSINVFESDSYILCNKGKQQILWDERSISCWRIFCLFNILFLYCTYVIYTSLTIANNRPISKILHNISYWNCTSLRISIGALCVCVYIYIYIWAKLLHVLVTSHHVNVKQKRSDWSIFMVLAVVFQ